MLDNSHRSVLVVGLRRRQLDGVGDGIEANIVIGAATVMLAPLIVRVNVTVRQTGSSFKETAQGAHGGPAVHEKRAADIAAGRRCRHNIADGKARFRDRGRAGGNFHTAGAVRITNLAVNAEEAKDVDDDLYMFVNG